MILNIDLGNTKLKWQEQKAEDSLSAVQSALNSDIENLDNLWRAEQIEKIKIASVGNSQIFDKIKNWAKCHNIEFLELKTQQEFDGISNAYRQNYQNLGIDRWLNIIAAYKNYGACFIVSCGSAMTLDKINARGEHLGGFIVPGFGFALQALKQKANFLHQIDFTDNKDFYGKDTNFCVSLGIEKMLQGLLYQAYNEENLPFVLTGGDAVLLAKNLRLPYQIDTDLIFKGIQIYN